MLLALMLATQAIGCVFCCLEVRDNYNIFTEDKTIQYKNTAINYQHTRHVSPVFRYRIRGNIKIQLEAGQDLVSVDVLF